MTLLVLITKVVAFVLFCMLSAFVFLFGKAKTGIKPYYVLTAVLLVYVLLVRY